MNNILDKVKPDWTHRRAYIKVLLVFLCASISIALCGSLALGYFAKFGLYISAFLITFVICNFMVLIGIVGSYIFGSRWETSDFLKILPHIIPNMVPQAADDNSGGDESDGTSVLDMIKGNKDQ